MTSYLTHFGLQREPFSAHVAGNSVFVAPQVAAIAAAMKKALSTEDAVVSLSGPVGSGKTTIAKRMLENVGQNRGVVTIGRMPFGTDEILEILLAGLGARQLPKSTVHRFATFRRLLQQFAEQNTRILILVEDAARIGVDALSELEALTAADAGVSNGANLILLGDDSIDELLRDPKMARLKQRLRTRQKIAAQSPGELQGYLKHCFRLAGREFDTIFADGSAGTLHGLSDGLPRVANNLLESVLKLAAEQGEKRITPEMIEQVAADEFGLTVAIEKAAAVENILPPESAPEIAETPQPAVTAPMDDIPELIQDTLPDLEILAPDLSNASQPITEAVHEPTESELPILSGPLPSVPETPMAAATGTNIPAEARDEDGKVPRDIPAWDRDPTFAELRPDLEALERAMAIAQGTDSVATTELQRDPAESENTTTAVTVIPEITLDKQIEATIQEATEALKKTQLDATAEIRNGDSASNDDQPKEKPDKFQMRPVPTPAENTAPAKEAQQPNRELENIASGIARARTIEDVDEHMAETLFGEEFSMLGAQVAANASSLQAEVERPPVAELSRALDTSASQRLSVLRELNKSSAPKGAPPSPDSSEDIVMSDGGLDTPACDDSVAVDSIEDQITTSMTQTIKTLRIRPNAVSDADDADDDADDADDDGDDDSDKGFFSRFRRK